MEIYTFWCYYDWTSQSIFKRNWRSYACEMGSLLVFLQRKNTNCQHHGRWSDKTRRWATFFIGSFVCVIIYQFAQWKKEFSHFGRLYRKVIRMIDWRAETENTESGRKEFRVVGNLVDQKWENIADHPQDWIESRIVFWLWLFRKHQICCYCGNWKKVSKKIENLRRSVLNSLIFWFAALWDWQRGRIFSNSATRKKHIRFCTWMFQHNVDDLFVPKSNY